MRTSELEDRCLGEDHLTKWGKQTAGRQMQSQVNLGSKKSYFVSGGLDSRFFGQLRCGDTPPSDDAFERDTSRAARRG